MTAASRSLATTLWRARFASGLLRPTYTTKRDTTRGGGAASVPKVIAEALKLCYPCAIPAATCLILFVRVPE